MRLLERVELAARAKYGVEAKVQSEPGRGFWLTGIGDQAVAATTLGELARTLGVSIRPMSRATLAKRLGIVDSSTVSRFVREHKVPYHIHNRCIVAYTDELRQWMKQTNYNRAPVVRKSRAMFRAAQAKRARRGAVAPNGQIEVLNPRRPKGANGALEQAVSQYARPPLLSAEAVREFIVTEGIRALERTVRK